MKEQRRIPQDLGESTTRTITDLSARVPNDTLYIYAPFDDKSAKQARVLRFLMDAQRFSVDCFPNFTFQEVAQFLEVRALEYCSRASSSFPVR